MSYPNFHTLQTRAYGRRIQQRIVECLTCTRPARRRWLRLEIARLRARPDWHAARVSLRCSAAVEACASEHRFYARRGATHHDQREREASLARAREALERGGRLLAAEIVTGAQGARGNDTENQLLTVYHDTSQSKNPARW